MRFSYNALSPSLSLAFPSALLAKTLSPLLLFLQSICSQARTNLVALRLGARPGADFLMPLL